MKNTYWNDAGQYHHLAEALEPMVPQMGPCPKNRPALEAFRKARHYYYDLYNNGGGNYRVSIDRFFGINSKYYRASRFTDHEMCVRVENKMDEVVLAAFREAAPYLTTRQFEIAAAACKGAEQRRERDAENEVTA